MMISDYIACSRCLAPIGSECTHSDPNDPSDMGQHSTRIHDFIRDGSLKDRIAIHSDTKSQMRAMGCDFVSDDESLFLSDKELAEFNGTNS